MGVAERPALYSAYSSVRKVCADVERDGDVGRLLVTEHVDEHRGEPVDGVGVLAGAGREVLGGQREEGAVGERMAVKKEKSTHAWQPRPSHPQPPKGHGEPAARPRSVPARHRGDEPELAHAAHGHRGDGGVSGPSGRHHAGRGQHPALRPAPRRGVSGARRDPRLHRGGTARGTGPGRRGPRHQRDAPPRCARRGGHRRRDCPQPGQHRGVLRDPHHRRGGQAGVHEPVQRPHPRAPPGA